MREADPEIKLVAVGAAGRWSEEMLKQAADHMDLISEHLCAGEARPGRARGSDDEPSPRQGGNSPSLSPGTGKRFAARTSALPRTSGTTGMGHTSTANWARYFLKDAGRRAALQEYARHSDLFYMANYAQIRT